MRPPVEDTKPWYRQFWPWFLIALPGSVIVASMVTIYLALQDADGLVTDDYYKEGLGLYKDVEAFEKAKAMGVSANLVYEAISSKITLNLAIKNGALPTKIRLKISHPTRRDFDQDIVLQPTETPGSYLGRIKPLGPANWHLMLKPNDGVWRLAGRLLRPDQSNLILE